MVSSTEKELKRRLSGVIKGDEADQYSSWQPPAMEGTLADQNKLKPGEYSSSTSPATGKSLEQITQDAYEEGFQKGVSDGQKAALEQQQIKITQLDAVIRAIRAKSEEFDEKITQQLVELTTVIAKQVLRKELTTSADAITAVVQEVLSMMPANSENMVLRLHPEDAQLIRQVFELDSSVEVSWKLFEDPSIQQGGCILSSDNSEINAELEQRITNVFNRVLGESGSDE